MPCPLRKFHALINRGMGRNPIQMQQLKRPHAQSDPHFRIELCIGMLQQRPNLLVQPNLPAQHAQHQRRRQIPIRRRQRIHARLAQQFVRVRTPALNSKQNVESNFSRWGNVRPRLSA